jgi:FkbM family methyltransferase
MDIRTSLKHLSRRLGLFTLLREAEVLAACALRTVHDVDFRSLPRDIGDREVVDIGANLGQSIVSLRSLFPGNHITSFEPNPACFRSLNRVARILGRIELHACGLGATDANMTFHVPTLRDGTALLQEGSFDRSVFAEPVTRSRIGADFTLAEQSVPVRTLDSMNLSPALLKIDVQGLELQVLAGAERTIRNNRPIILLEMESRAQQDIERFLRSFGYGARRLAANCLFVPAGD